MLNSFEALKNMICCLNKCLPDLLFACYSFSLKFQNGAVGLLSDFSHVTLINFCHDCKFRIVNSITKGEAPECRTENQSSLTMN